MRNRIILAGLLAAVIYIRGARSHRPIEVRPSRGLGARAGRAWRDPKAAKARKKLAKKVAAKASDRLGRSRLLGSR